MKVMIIVGHLKRAGGVANYMRLLVDYFRNSDNSNIYPELFIRGLKPKYHKKIIAPFVFLFQFFKLPLKLRSANPDVVHINPSLTWASIIRDILFLRIAKAQGYPVLFFFHGWRWGLYEKIRKNDIIRKTFVNNLKKADKILVLSQDFKEALVEIGVEEDRIGLTSTMVEVQSYSPKNKTFDKPYNVLFCSRIAKDKGPYELLEAIPKILDEFPKTKFIFMGDGPCLEDLKSKASSMGIQDSVLFIGYKKGDDKIKWYKKSDLFIFPSHTEGFPNVYLEALATGLPVVATPVGALKYALKDGKNGYKLESTPVNPEEIAKKIIKLLRDPIKLKKISQNNLKEAKEKYDVEIICSQTIDFYLKIYKSK